MRHSWQSLVNVDIEHGYGKLKNGYFYTSPAPETKRLMKNYELLFREKESGFFILYSTSGEGSEILRPISGRENFRFYLTPKSPDFGSITDIPMDSQKIFVFSNVSSAKDGGKLPLHANSPSGDTVSAADSYELTSQKLRLNEAASAPVKYEVLDRSGTIVISKTLAPVEGVIFYEEDFSHRPAGLYELRKDGVKVKEFYADNFLIRNKAFAVVEIHTGEGVPDDYAIVDSNGAVTSRSYILKFKSRSSTWRYFVIPRHIELEDDDILVVEGNSDITFSAGVIKSLPGESTAYVFESTGEFALSKTSRKNIALKKEDGVTKVLVNQLPTPEASNLMIEEEKVYSDIFVYI